MGQQFLDPLAKTALWTASMRAREHAREDRLFEEPLASLLATDDGPKIMRAFEGDVQKGVEDPALAVRTRFLDDQIRQAATRFGIRQFVFVAAGMDTRGYRLTWPTGSVLFELDRSGLFDLKDELLSAAHARPGCVVHRIGVDLLNDWVAAVIAAGFRSSVSTLWLVEGLFYFLTDSERDKLLKEMTMLSAPGSRLLADYVTQTALDSPGMRAWRQKMADSGHPWKSGCDQPEEVFGGQGWTARVTAYGSPGADYGRWAASQVAPGESGTRGRYIIDAVFGGPSESAM